MKTNFILCFLIFVTFLNAQIKGKIIDPFQNPVENVNIYIKNTIIGTSSNENGLFEIPLKDIKNLKNIELVFENTGFKTIVQKYNSKSEFIKITLFPDDYLDEVKVSSVGYESSPNSKNAVLKPFDIKTNPAALGDVVHGLLILPGVQNNANDGKLFLKGGDSNENAFFIDGINILNPYTSTPNGTPARSRYSPDLFKGIKLNTGSYSSEFGQALSGALFLDFLNPENTENKLDFSVTSVGIGSAISHKKKKNFIYSSIDYTNLTPYRKLFPDNLDWEKYYSQASFNFFHQFKTEKITNKNFIYFNNSGFKVNLKDINLGEINNDFSDYSVHLQSTWNIKLPKKYNLYLGSGFDFINQNIKGIFTEKDKAENKAEQVHLKINLLKNLGFTKLSAGTEYIYKNFQDKYKNQIVDLNGSLKNPILANFIEINTLFFKRFGANLGLRNELSTLNKNAKIDPRIILNYSINQNQNVSFSYGIYHQTQENKYLRTNKNLEFSASQNASLNYKFKKDNHFFNAEIFHKKYDKLITFNNLTDFNYKFISTNGFGNSYGFDAIYKGNSIKNLTYWFSYSYIKSERKYLDFPEKSVPNFSPEHNFSFLGKYWISSLKSQVGMNTSFNSGFSYNNPNEKTFNNSKTPFYFDLSLSYSYVIKPNIILHASTSNLLNYKNIYGYNFSKIPNENGFYESTEKISSSNRFFFVGFFISLNKSKTTNKLEDL